jgi:putative hydrolase of the HAD superfamily
MPITTLLFDLDNTLYPFASGLTQAIDERMTAYVQRLLGIDAAQALALRRESSARHGMTLYWLMAEHGVDGDAYLRDVHTIEYAAFLRADAELDRRLGELPGRKVIFTNAPSEHAKTVLELLGLARHFERIFDIRFCGLRGKPNPESYRQVLHALNCRPADALLVEDTARNLLPAQNLGITTVFIGEETPDGADYNAPDILAALGVIRSIVR